MRRKKPSSWIVAILLCTSVVSPAVAQTDVTSKVRVDDHVINMLVTGRGSPTVVLESGFGNGLSSWGKVQPELAKHTRVVAYDRAGLGQSEPCGKPRTARQMATELRAALKESGVSPPYVLVGHSMGGLYLSVFAGMYPKDVAGMVLVDPATEDFAEWVKTRRPDDYKALAGGADAPAGVKGEAASLEVTLKQARESRLPKVPVILMTSMRPEPPFRNEEMLEVWMKTHKQWLARVPNAKHIVTEKSGHYIHQQESELFIDAVRQVVKSAKNNAAPNNSMHQTPHAGASYGSYARAQIMQGIKTKRPEKERF